MRCKAPSKHYGRVLLASPPCTRYPYIYPRDTSSAVQLFRRLAGSKHEYDGAGQAFKLMKAMAHFIKDVQAESGCWGQRYNLDGYDKSLYKQEDNVAHGIAVLCNFLLMAQRLREAIDNLDEFLHAIDRALAYSLEKEVFMP